MGTAILLVALLLTLAGCGKKKPGNDTSPTEGPTGVTGGVTEAITPTVAETVVTINAPRTEEPTPTGPVPTESLAILTEETVAGEWFASLRGITYRLALSADGKYEAGFPELSGEKTTGTWGLIGEQIVLDDNADALLVREEGLFWEGPGVAFAREKPVAADAGKPDKTVTAADFAGFWSSVYVRTESGLAPAADLGEDTDVYVEGNTVVLGGSIFGDTMCTFAYADGAMTWSAGEGAEAVSVRLELTDRGLMLLTMKTGGSEELSLYLTSRDIDWLLGE